MLVAVGGGGTILTSTNGTLWTARASGTTETLHSVSFGDGGFVAVGTAGTGPNGSLFLTSPDGITWTRRQNPATTPLFSVTYALGSFVAVGDRARSCSPIKSRRSMSGLPSEEPCPRTRVTASPTRRTPG